MNKEIIHLMTQRDQPYGSTRRCCERCGIMIWGPSDIAWTDDPGLYKSPPDEYINCDDFSRMEREVNKLHEM